MRNDAIIDRRQVRCPNASHIGYSKPVARVGDLITFTEGYRTITARMIGRVHYAPKLAANDPEVKDWILAVCLNDKLDHTFERWVNPAYVILVEDIRLVERQKVLAWFLSDDMTREPVNDIRQSMEWGGILPEYRAYQAKRQADLADFNRRHPNTTEHISTCQLCSQAVAKGDI